MNNTEAATYYRGRAMRCRMLANQANDARRAAQYRELAAAFEKEADSRDSGFPPNGGPSA